MEPLKEIDSYEFNAIRAIGYTRYNEKEYWDIIKRTHVLYSKTELPMMRAAKNTKTKYQRIIGPGLRRPRSSASAPTIQTKSKVGKRNLTLMKINKYPFDYKYVDNSSEIVDILSLLIASETAEN